MAIDRTLAVTLRVLRQIRRDHRSIIMILFVPCFLLWILQITFQNVPGIFDKIAPMLLGTFPFVMIFLVKSITMLRERNTGTLDRMLISPIGRADIMVGYAFAFSILATIQTAISMFFAVVVQNVPVHGSSLATFLIVLLIGVYGTALGLTLSAFARTEFQAVQFMPLFLLPQIFLSGLLVSVDQMPTTLRWLAAINPLRYAFDLLSDVMQSGTPVSERPLELVLVASIPVLVLFLGATTMRRQSND